ncbi:MAG: hypothetical protein ACRD2L_20500 [Terriglobia bacterium]
MGVFARSRCLAGLLVASLIVTSAPVSSALAPPLRTQAYPKKTAQGFKELAELVREDPQDKIFYRYFDQLDSRAQKWVKAMATNNAAYALSDFNLRSQNTKLTLGDFKLVFKLWKADRKAYQGRADELLRQLPREFQWRHPFLSLRKGKRVRYTRKAQQIEELFQPLDSELKVKADVAKDHTPPTRVFLKPLQDLPVVGPATSQIEERDHATSDDDV